MTRKSLLAASIALASPILIGAATPMQSANPSTTVTVTADKAHILGNPEAKAKLTEYVSYTCSHCATFEREASDAIKLQYVATGKLRFEVRHYLFNIADLTVATATHCLPKERFFAAHTAMLQRQDEWAPKYFGASPAQQARYAAGTPKQRLQAVASDIGLYETMENHGLTRARLDQCFGDATIYQPIIAQTQEAQSRGISGTPTFEFNGTRMPANTAKGVTQILAAAMRALK